MHYHVAFSRITEPKLRRLILGDKEIEPLTAVAYVSPWVWEAVREIARREKRCIAWVLARAVRRYVISEGYNAPNFKKSGAGDVPTAPDSTSRPGLVARIAGHFKR